MRSTFEVMSVVDSMMPTISKAQGAFLFFCCLFGSSFLIICWSFWGHLGTILGPDWPKKTPRRVKESYMVRFVTMTLLRPCRLSSWLFAGLPGTPQRIYFAGNALKYNKSCLAMAVIYMLYHILWCARVPTKMHHEATPTLLSLFRDPHLLNSRSGFGGLLKYLRVFLLFSPYGSSSSVSRRESGQRSLHS